MAEAITVPLTGWLAQRFTQVRLAVACILLFTLASILCGLSTSLGMLVFARVLQGLAGGPIMALTQTLLLASFPRHKAGTASRSARSRVRSDRRGTDRRQLDVAL